MQPVARQERSTATQTALLDAAERLFAERGLLAVSLREIGAEAGQRNQAASQYHFGDKRQLVLAVFERRALAINQRRLELLAEAVDRGTVGVHDLIHVFVAPLGEEVDRGTPYVCFLSRLLSDGESLLLREATIETRSAFERIGQLLRTDHFPTVPAALFWNRWRLAINTALWALADHQTGLDRQRAGELPTSVYTTELVDALAGMMFATGAAGGPTSVST